jgi:D-alanyl-D-alanine dipeptidase
MRFSGTLMPHPFALRPSFFWASAALSLLGALGCSSPAPLQPPKEAGDFRQPDLVEMSTLEPTIRLDIRYAGADNFLGRPVYGQARAFLQRPAAEALRRVQKAVEKDGYTLIVFDGYRPWRVTRIFWVETPPAKHDFVADPAKGSKHNRGCAVDLTLGDSASGKEVTMPSSYDEFSERANPGYQGGLAEPRRMRDYLRAAMEREGFTVYEHEWWHFDYKDWKEYPILDIDFSELRS